MKSLFALLSIACLSSFAQASVTVAYPHAGAEVLSPFNVQAAATPCQTQPIAAMAYSLDSGTDTVVYSAALNASVKAAAGAHTVHIKAWGNKGAECTSNVAVDVLTKLPTIPANVSTVANIQGFNNWVGEHDAATSGNSSGSTGLVGAPSLTGPTRQFRFSYTNDGGQRFHSSFAANPTATHFVYDTYVMFDPCTGTSCGTIANLEMDMNQVLTNGDVVIYGVQCDGWTGTWDYTVNDGTPTQSHSTWIHSNLQCDPRKWTRNAWHHVQLTYSRDTNGDVTYETVSLDGVEQAFSGATGPSLFALRWGQVLLTNLQLDGMGASGAQSVELSSTTVYAW